MYFRGFILLIQTVAFLESLDEFIQFTYAVSNKMTIRELKDIWMHRHLFSIVKVYKPPELDLTQTEPPSFFFDFKSYNICNMVSNLFCFICSGHPEARSTRSIEKDIGLSRKGSREIFI